MTSEISGAAQLNQTGPFKNWTSLNEVTLALSDTADNYFPTNVNTVYLKQTTAGVTQIELPIPLALTDGQSRMWFCYWSLSGAAATADCTLTLLQPQAVTGGSYYAYPITKIQRTSADYSIVRTYSAGDTRTLVGFILWCTNANNYYVAGMGDAATFGSIVAGTGRLSQPTSAPDFSAGSWKINAFSGQNVTLCGTVVNSAGSIGPLGWNTTAATAGYWQVCQPGNIQQLYFAAAGAVAGVVKLTYTRGGVTADTGLTVTASAATGSDLTHVLAVQAGDLIQAVFTAPGASAGITSVSFVFRPSAV